MTTPTTHTPLDAYEVYVRARSPSGRWWSAPAIELDEDSFRRFVLDTLHKHGLVVGLRTGMTPDYTTKTEPPRTDL